MGMRPIVDVQYGDFLFLAMDQIVNNAAKLRYMSGGTIKVPMVMRAPVGATGRGSQHAQSMERYFTGVPGIKVVAVSNAYDAKGILKSAVRDDNPVLIFEHKLLYGSKGARTEPGAVDATSDIPDGDYTVPLDRAAVRREGPDVTILAWLLMAHFAMQAADALAAEGIDAEVIDVRSLSPIDYETIGESVQKTGRVVIVEEGPKTGGVSAEIAAGSWNDFGEPAGAGRPRRLGRRAGAVHAGARERLPAGRGADRRGCAHPLSKRQDIAARMTEHRIIAFDAGGSAVKAALYDELGAELAVAAVGMPPLHPGPGCLERDPEAMWAAVCDVTRKVLSASGVEPSSISAVGLTGYGNGLFLVDRDGRPVRNAILSPDLRAQAIVASWRAEGAEARSAALTYNPQFPGKPLPLIAWLEAHEPEALQRADRALFCKDYLRFRLTGAIGLEISDMSSASLADQRLRRWTPDVLEPFGLSRYARLFGDGVEPLTIAGAVTEKAAAETGLAAGTSVSAGYADGPAMALPGSARRTKA